MSEPQKDDSDAMMNAVLMLISMGLPIPSWEERLKELADYRKIHGTAMFLNATVKTLQVGKLGRKQRSNTSCTRRKEIDRPPSESRIASFEWDRGAAWEDR
jgi:hypothetical protein